MLDQGAGTPRLAASVSIAQAARKFALDSTLHSGYTNLP